MYKRWPRSESEGHSLLLGGALSWRELVTRPEETVSQCHPEAIAEGSRLRK